VRRRNEPSSIPPAIPPAAFPRFRFSSASCTGAQFRSSPVFCWTSTNATWPVSSTRTVARWLINFAGWTEPNFAVGSTSGSARRSCVFPLDAFQQPLGYCHGHAGRAEGVRAAGYSVQSLGDRARRRPGACAVDRQLERRVELRYAARTAPRQRLDELDRRRHGRVNEAGRLGRVRETRAHRGSETSFHAPMHTSARLRDQLSKFSSQATPALGPRSELVTCPKRELLDLQRAENFGCASTRALATTAHQLHLGRCTLHSSCAASSTRRARRPATAWAIPTPCKSLFLSCAKAGLPVQQHAGLRERHEPGARPASVQFRQQPPAERGHAR